ncbi:MAG TPA: GAF domain-containing sensor histidine kinase [Planctomycetota bacterium]|nr:GAF domain-containing sensor histidine kinase [Planctomycetota bacterium]
MPAVTFDLRLIRLIRDLSFARSIQDVMDAVKTVARDLTGADGVTFVLREGDNCYYAEENAIGPLWKGKRFPLSACISGWAMLNKRPAIVPNIYEDPRIPIDAYRPTFVRSLVMMPVRLEDPIAAIGAYWAAERTPAPEEILQLQAVADSAAVAIANVELLGDLKRSAERERALRMEAEQANRAKDEFLAVVSHELRTPLTPLLGWSRLLKPDSAPQELAQGLDIIARQVEMQRRVVDDLLDFSRMTLGKMEMKFEPLLWSTVINNAIDSVRGLAASRKIAIEASLDPSVTVNGDRDRLQQVAWNLLTNAVKFSLPGQPVVVMLIENGGEATLTVEDFGEGIPPEFLPKLFQRFSQRDSSTTRKHGGLGLGLSIVRHVVEMHGGRVKAESPGVGQGAKFSVTLPLTQ